MTEHAPLSVGERIVADVGLHHPVCTICEIRVDLFGGTRLLVQPEVGIGWWMSAESIGESLDGEHRIVVGRWVPAPV